MKKRFKNLKIYIQDLKEKWRAPVLKRAKEAEKEIDYLAKELINLFEQDLSMNKPIIIDNTIINYARISDYQKYNNDLIKTKVINYYKNKGKWDKVLISEYVFLYSHKELVLELKLNIKK